MHGNVLAEAVRDTATGETRIRRWSYTASMLLASATEADGAVWTFGYDASGNRTSTTNPMGQVTKFTYDAAGRATGRTDPGGLLTAMAYDARGRLVQVDTGGEITAFSYNATGQVSSATLPNGLQMLYGYDAAQRLMMVSDNRGQATGYTLDAMGNPVHQEVRDANGNLAWAAGRVIDSLNRVTSLEDAFGQSTRYVYDGNGAPVASTDPVNRTTRQVRDALGRVTATVFPDSASAAQSWDALDGIAAVTDPKGVATRYRTNSFGEAVAETSPDTGGMTWERDINGNVVSEIDAKGSTAIVERDALGRPARVQYSDHTRSFQYDAAGRVSSVADNSGSTSYIRDALGRVISKTQLVAYSDPPGVFKVAYEWHQGDLAGVDYPSGLKVMYRRSAGRVTQIDVQPAPNRSGKPQPIGAFLTSLAYTALGQPQAWRWASGDAARRNFDINGRMTASELGRNGFDATGHITLVSQNLWARKTVGTSTELYQLPLTWTAAYDARGRLTSFWRPGAASAYNYDANGNRLTGVETSTGDSDLEGMVDQPGIALETAQTARIDPASNRLVGFTQTMTASREGVTVSSVSSQVNYAVDANGAMTSDGLRTFEYDAARRLAKVKAFRNGEGADIEYLHNAMNQRVFKSQLTPQQLAKGEERLDQGFINWLKQVLGWFFSGGNDGGPRSMLGVSFVYDEEGRMLGEYDNGTAGNAGRTEYIWLPSEAGEYPTLVGLYKNGKFYQVHTDHLGSPRLVTDGDNAPVWQWPYSAFGNNKPIAVLQVTETSTGATAFKATKPPVEQNLRYPGQYDDSEFQLVDNWNRTYLRSQGRYGQPDPTGLAAGLNRFIYAGSNPLASIDPMGLDVTVYTYPGQNGNPGGHMAIGVNANPIVGFDPVPSASVWSTILGKDVPGTIDAIRLGRKPEDYVTIYTTPAQDRAIQNYLLLKSQTPGIYNIKAANCATTVHDALNAGNISSLQTMWPRDLMKNLKRIANP